MIWLIFYLLVAFIALPIFGGIRGLTGIKINKDFSMFLENLAIVGISVLWLPILFALGLFVLFICLCTIIDYFYNIGLRIGKRLR